MASVDIKIAQPSPVIIRVYLRFMLILEAIEIRKNASSLSNYFLSELL
jgi:hypothetical protein